MNYQFFSEDRYEHDGHVSRVFAACFHPRNNYELITGGWDNVVQFWDLRQPYAVRHLSQIFMGGEGLDINQKGTEVSMCIQKKYSQNLFSSSNHSYVVTFSHTWLSKCSI